MSGGRLVTVPAGMNMVIVREEYLAITNGDACAAALLNWFERWAVWLNDHKRPEWVRVQNQQALVKPLMGVFSEWDIKRGLKALRDWGFIKAAAGGIHGWDRKLMYAFVVEKVQAALDAVFDRLDPANASAGSSLWIGCQPPMHKRNPDNASAVGKQSTLEDQEVDQKNDQESSAGRARVRDEDDDDLDSQTREGIHPSKMFSSTRIGALNTPPPSSAPPPSPVVKAFEANIGKAGAAVRAAISEAVERHGETVVIEKIELAAKHGARTWAYVQKALGERANPADDAALAATDMDHADDYDWLKARGTAAGSPEGQVWGAVVDRLEYEVERDAFETWLTGATCDRVEPGAVYVVQVKNPYARDFLATRWYRLIVRVLREIAGAEADVRFELAGVMP